MKKFKLIKFSSFLLCLMLVFSFFTLIHVNASDDIQRITYDGITYEVKITYDMFGNRVATVTSDDGIISTVVNDGVYFHITEQNTITGEAWERKIRLKQ
jgi:hypothetical protein